jgi:hypothetical protein
MIERTPAFDRYNVARLGEISGDDCQMMELQRVWENREPRYRLTVFWRDEDMTYPMSRDELKRLGETLVRLANATFLEPAP